MVGGWPLALGEDTSKLDALTITARQPCQFRRERGIDHREEDNDADKERRYYHFLSARLRTCDQARDSTCPRDFPSRGLGDGAA